MHWQEKKQEILFEYLSIVTQENTWIQLSSTRFYPLTFEGTVPSLHSFGTFLEKHHSASAGAPKEHQTQRSSLHPTQESDHSP